MISASFFVFLPSVLIGCLSVHLSWPERTGTAVLLKIFLGVGVGLGMSSLLYFAALVFVRGRAEMWLVQLILLALLVGIVYARERRAKWSFGVPVVSRLQWVLIGAAVLSACAVVLSFLILAAARPQGGIDAWSIWNRAARFIYRDPENWRATLSPQLHWHSHADYPLLLPLNVAWAWQALNSETPRAPMMQGALFTLAGLGLMFAAVAQTRTIGQASLATLVLSGTPYFVMLGSGMVGDVPLTYYMLAAGVLLFLSSAIQSPGLLALCGFMAGLAAWTKNEGFLFSAVIPVALILIRSSDAWRRLAVYTLGLAVPLAAVLYFRSIAPASELFQDPGELALTRIMDASRYSLILKELGEQAIHWGPWPFSIFAGLAVYALVVRADVSDRFRRGVYAVAVVLLLQFLGYFLIYVISPHDLEWHLNTALYRLILHLFPTSLFLLFAVISDPERIFAPAEGAK